jgi:hypothetical protein
MQYKICLATCMRLHRSTTRPYYMCLSTVWTPLSRDWYLSLLIENWTKFVISGRLESDYAKEPKDRRSVLGHVVILEGAPAMFKSSTERTVSLSTTKAETYAGVNVFKSCCV